MAKRNDAGHPGEVPGNTMMSQRAHDEFVYGLGRAWLECLRMMELLVDQGTTIKRVTLKGSMTANTDMLVVLTADGPEGPVVAFHNVDDVYGLWRGLGNRIRNGSLKWREDEYAR